jgi:hypothetical protein
MALTVAETDTLQFIATLTSLLSIFGSSAIISTILKRRHESSLLRVNTIDATIFVMSVLDILSSLSFSFGVLPYEGSGRDEGSFACQLQAFSIETFALATVFWNVCMAHNLYMWVVVKADLSMLSKNLKYYLAVSLGVPLVLATSLAAEGHFGFAQLWCWIGSSPASQPFRFTAFYLVVVLAWLVNLAVFVKVKMAMAQNKSNSASAIEAQNAVQKKMAQYITIFSIVWFFGLLNRTIQDLAHETQVWALVLHVMFVPLQGFLNAIVYGGLLETAQWKEVVKKLNCGRAKDPIRKLWNNSKNPLLSDVRPPSYVDPASRNKWSPLPSADKRSVSVFISTYNLAEKTLADLDDFHNWLPSDPSVHDLYAIGVQECMCLAEVREALHAQLGGPAKYTMFVAEIGSTNTALGFHGYIAVTVFARTADVESGAFYMPAANVADVKKGADLMVTKAPNKGAVGIPFVYHDTSLAFFTGHFAANSKGRNRLKARLADSRDTLSKAVLTVDDIGFDTQLTHHHVFIFGDLNFRCTSSPQTVLDLVAAASKAEMDAVWGGNKQWRKMAYEGTARKHPFAPKQLPQKVEIAWNRVLALDELQLVMGESEIFHSFVEPGGLPKFPPSFRRKMGAAGECGDYTDAGLLAEAYTTSVKEKAKGGAGGDGAAAAEEDGEDVDEDGISRSLDVRATATERSMAVKLRPGERIPSYTDRILYHTLPGRMGDITPGPYEVCDQVVASDHRPVTATFQILTDPRVVRGNGKSETGKSCLLHLAVSKWEVKGDWSASVEPAAVVVVFPLPTEDPLVEERRVQTVASALFTGNAEEGDKMYSSSSSSEPLVVNKREIMTADTTVAWVKGEARMISEACPDIGVHALVKLMDKFGDCLGQGVVPLERMTEGALGGKRAEEMVDFDMSLGGKLVGELRANFAVSELFKFRGGGRGSGGGDDASSNIV